jgi:4-amino-4-deoxy-L-arabinose transferase-like glycosyltransferase
VTSARGWAIAVLAFAARMVGVVTRVRGGRFVDPDETAFAQLARTLTETGRFSMSATSPPEVIRGPSYVLWLSLLERLFGPRELLLLTAQAALGAVAVWLCARELARLLLQIELDARWRQRLWWTGAILLALSPFTIFYERLLLSEGFATVLVVAGTLAFLRAFEGRSRWWAVAAGAAFGLMILAKPALMGLPPALALVAIVAARQRGLGRALVAPALMVLVSVAVVAPWTARNFGVLRRFVPVGIGGGVYIYLATLPSDENGVTFPDAPDRKLLDRYLDPDLPTKERVHIDDDFRARGNAEIKAHPGSFVRLASKRPFRMWVSSHAGELRSPPPRVVRLGIALIALLLVMLATISVVIVPRALRPPIALLWMVPAYVTVAHTPIMSGGRYTVPAWPFVMVLAIVAVAALWSRRRAAARATSP